MTQKYQTVYQKMAYLREIGTTVRNFLNQIIIATIVQHRDNCANHSSPEHDVQHDAVVARFMGETVRQGRHHRLWEDKRENKRNIGMSEV